jgi:Lipase (class 3)
MELIQNYADLAFAAYAPSDRAAAFYAKQSYKVAPIHTAESDRDEGYLLERNGILLIAIRGSDDIRDWCQTNLCLWRNWRHAHAGFASAASAIYDRIRPSVAMFRQSDSCNKTAPIVVLGHSRGGAIGLHLAGILNANGYRAELCSFGAPRAASPAWVKTVNFVHIRVVHMDDCVPHLPPEQLGYKHHGTPFLIGGDAPQQGDTPWCELKLEKGGYRSILTTLKSDRCIKGHFAYSQVKYLL